MAVLENAVCRLEGCGGPQSGVCINKLSFDECPDVVAAGTDDSSVAGDTLTTLGEAPSAAALASSAIGDSLDLAACDGLLRATGGELVGIVAGPEAGKTTLIATIYERIHRNLAQGVGFAGSESVRGYERRCHFSRLASNGTAPDTERTKFLERLSFTHLRVAVAGLIQDLVFSDRTGEDFDNALDKPDALGGFVELGRARTIWLIVDLDELSKSPHVLKSHLRRIVMAMEKAGLFDGKNVSVVGTKIDLFPDSSGLTEIETDLRALADDLQHRMANVSKFLVFMVGCRPAAGTTEFGIGLDELLSSLKPDTTQTPCEMGVTWPQQPHGLDNLMHRLAGSA
jgi:Double-GTPase 2